MTTRQPKTKGFQNLSTNPAEAQAETVFATQVEDLMQNAGIPKINQLHILSQVQTDLAGQVSSDQQG